MRAVVLVSGGLDSTTMLYDAYEQTQVVQTLSFDYGQRHKKELEAALRTAERLSLPWTRIDLTSLTPLLKGSALSDPMVEVPHGHYAKETMTLTIVPNRNSIMLSAAVGVALGQACNEVWAAMHSGDHAIYPDCRPEFVDKLNELVPIATESDVRVITPYINMSKADIVRRGYDLDVPFEETWSCYEGGEVHCGRCGTCVERQEAFYLANVPDPTEYLDSEFWKVEVGLA